MNFFFIDKNNFFRQKIFGSRALCGSASIIKPNGQILVRNEEGSMYEIIKDLEPEKWKIFFKEKTN